MRMETILGAVCDEFGVAGGDLGSRTEDHGVGRARAAAAFLCRRLAPSHARPPLHVRLGTSPRLAYALEERAREMVQTDLAFAESLMRIVDRLEMDLPIRPR